MIGFLSFISKINCTALPCLFFVISFRCCWVEFPWRYRSCLLAQDNVSRLALCLVRIELKLRRFRSPHLWACCKYLTSISQVSHKLFHKPVFIGLNYWCGLHLKLKDLLYSQKYSHWIRVLHYCFLLWAASMGTTIEQSPVKGQLSQQFWQSQGCFFTCARAILEYDVLLKCVLLANFRRLCWALQVVEWRDVLVYTNDVLQC